MINLLQMELEVLVALVLLLNLSFLLMMMFIERKNASKVISWAMLLIFLPFVGFILYLFIGQSFYSDRVFSLKAEADEKTIQKIFEEQEIDLKNVRETVDDPELLRYLSMANMLLEEDRAILSGDNDVQLFVDGVTKFESLFRDIDAAEQSIYMEYYLIRNDDLAKRMVDVLAKKAKEGVEVRFMVDAVGRHKIPSKFFKKLTDAGGKVETFHSFWNTFLNPRVNNRNHRKIAVIDKKIGYVGGYNIGDEYINRSKKWGFWRDSAVRVQGTGVFDMHLRFMRDWNYASKEKLGYDAQYYEWLKKTSLLSEGSSLMQVVSCGPDTRWSAIEDAYTSLVNGAEDTVYIQTPYFVPDEGVLSALRIAAHSGKDVRIMIPNRPDHPFVHWVSYSNIGELLEAGVKAYTYERGFVHAKTVVIDESAASLGSANWDIRSFHLNFETNVVIYDVDFAKEMKNAFLDDVERYCKEITLEQYQDRSFGMRVLEGISRLFSGLL